MLEAVLQRALRAAFGGGAAVDLDLPTEFDELKAALATAVEAAIDTGTATGGSNTTIVDTGKGWAVDMWIDATFEVEIGAIHYLGIVTGNTATTITFAALPGGAMVIAGCDYGLKRPVDIADISDRAGRLLGVVQSLTQWGGTALTGRDISGDLQALIDDSITGLLKSIGDIAALENLITRIGQTSDASVAAGAVGSISAKLRRATQGLEDLKTLIVLAAGTNLIGAVNPRSEAGAGQTPVGVTVTAASTLILAANANRKAAVITNDSDTTIYVAIGVAAQANKGIRLNANGGVLVISRTGDIYSTEAVYGILAAAGNKIATAQELN